MFLWEIMIDKHSLDPSQLPFEEQEQEEFDPKDDETSRQRRHKSLDRDSLVALCGTTGAV